MAELTKKQRVRAALAGEPVDRPPASMWGHDFTREWSPEKLVESTLEQYRAYDWDFIKLNPRASYFAEAWGSEYGPPVDDQAAPLTSAAIGSAADLAALRPVNALGGVFEEHLTALSLLLKEVGDEVDIVHTVFSPLSVVGRLCGPESRLVELAAEDPTSVHSAIAAVTQTLTEYSQAALEVGAAGIFFAPLRWASHDVCTTDFYREFGRPYDLQLLSRIRDAEFNILHVCRDNNMIDLLLDYPVAVINWADHGAGNPSLADVKARTTKAVMGGVDHARLDSMTATEAGDQAAAALATGPERLFITAGCSIPPATPEESREAVAAAARG